MNTCSNCKELIVDNHTYYLTYSLINPDINGLVVCNICQLISEVSLLIRRGIGFTVTFPIK